MRDLPVIVQHIAFGEPRLWPVAFLKVRYLYGLASQLPRFRGGTHTDGLLTMVLAVAVFTVLAILYGSTKQDCIVLMIYIVSS